MDTNELMQVVRVENLDMPVLYGVGDRHTEAVVLERGGGVWTTSLVDEDFETITATLCTFDTETAALWNVLRMLRQMAAARPTALADHAGSRRSGDFAPDSLRTGAALPVMRGQLMNAIESRLTDLATTKDRHDQWLADGVPLFSRGVAWIVPLSWETSLVEGDAAEWPGLRDRARELRDDVRLDCEHSHGYPIGVDLDPETGRSGYSAELRRTGARNADWWRFDSSAVVRVIYGAPSPAPATLSAVHVVPIDWVSDSRGRRKLKDKIDADLSWTWADVIDFTWVYAKG